MAAAHKPCRTQGLGSVWCTEGPLKEPSDTANLYRALHPLSPRELRHAIVSAPHIAVVLTASGTKAAARRLIGEVHGLPIIPATERLVRAVIYVLRDEVNRAVDEGEVGPLRVIGFEAEGNIRVIAGYSGARRPGIDWNDGGTVRVTTFGAGPVLDVIHAPKVLAEWCNVNVESLLSGQGFANKDRVGSAVQHMGHGELITPAIKHTAKVHDIGPAAHGGADVIIERGIEIRADAE